MALPKLFQRIFFNNNSTPALNADNLNAMSKAIDDIDNRLIEVGSDALVIVPQIQAYLAQSENLVEAMTALSTHPPYIGSNGNWYVWNTETSAFVDSGIDASITVNIADITMLDTDADPYITNTGTNTDPVFHLFIPRGATGQSGLDGISSSVAITSIPGGHTVTITDKEHPTGQSFNVMDGTGTGDMRAAVYDPQSIVANAGGIAAYAKKKATILNQTLAANATSVTFTGIPTSGNYIISFYIDGGANYTAINTATSGQVTLTYDAESSARTVYCEIEEVS